MIYLLQRERGQEETRDKKTKGKESSAVNPIKMCKAFFELCIVYMRLIFSSSLLFLVHVHRLVEYVVTDTNNRRYHVF